MCTFSCREPGDLWPVENNRNKMKKVIVVAAERWFSVKTLAGNIYAGSISSEIRRRNVLDFWSGPAIRITPFKVEYTGHGLPGTGIKERNTWRIWRRENVDWTGRRGTRGSGYGALVWAAGCL